MRHGDVHFDRLHFRMGGTDERLGAATHLGTLHELDLRAVKVHAVFAVNGRVINIQLAGKNHLRAGKEGRRRLVNQPRLNKKTEANRQQGNPPAALQE